MKKTIVLLFALCSIAVYAADWDNVDIPVDASMGSGWTLQENVSDDFNYTFTATDNAANFGTGDIWKNFYHSQWDGPGTTYWKYNETAVNGKDLVISSSRWDKTTQSNPTYPYVGATEEFKMGEENNGINAGCVTSNNKVLYPVFVEASVSVAHIQLASDVWLLSGDDWQEIDIIECYGEASGFQDKIHLSHHYFKRDNNPILDYQPRDAGTWWARSGVTSWGDYCWNNGTRKYVSVGVYWVSPKHLRYYVDGDLVRVIYDKGLASKSGTTWTYQYHSTLPGNSGYHYPITYSTNNNIFSMDALLAADALGSYSAIDPNDYQKIHNRGSDKGFITEQDIIINLESQGWHVLANRVPSDADLLNSAKNTMLVDWIRVYKPDNFFTSISDTDGSEQSISARPNPSNGLFYIDNLSEGTSQVSVINIKGQSVSVSQIDADNNRIDLSNQPAGLYLVKVVDKNNTVFTTKVRKE